MANIKLFEDKNIRVAWNTEEQEWYFSVIDVIGVLTDSVDATAYWRKLKERLKAEGNETVTNCHGLKMKAPDGKMRLTDVLNTSGVLRLVQSVPSKKAEPFKLWLAKVGAERLDEIADPERSFTRGIETYLRKGYSPEWVSQRLLSIEVRKRLTDEWQKANVTEDVQYAILTDEITKAWSGKTVRQYKEHKGLKKASLRDNMTNLELVLNMLAEATTTQIAKKELPEGFVESLDVAKRGGSVAGEARAAIERAVGESVISAANGETPAALDVTAGTLGLGNTVKDGDGNGTKKD